ncbi:MAG: hypothetical protein ACYC91_04110 [Solirubrobacteraceae bacterium]
MGGSWRGAPGMVVGTAAVLLASAGVAVAKPAHISSVVTSGSSATPEITVHGAGFGSRPAPNPPGPPFGHQSGCPVVPVAKAGHLFGTQLYFTDLKAKRGTYTSWSAGQFTSGGNGFFDCVGLVIDRWTRTEVQFHFGATYGKFLPQNTYFLSAGDRFRAFVRGASFLVARAVFVEPAKPSAPIIRSVATSGSVAAPEITVKGSGFGSRPAPDPANFAAELKPMGCPVVPAAKAGHLFGTLLYFTDLKAKRGTYKNWTAGQFTPGSSGFFDCVGLVIDQWSSTKVRFHFGASYGKVFPGNTYFFSNGDRFKVFVRGGAFAQTAKLG